MEGNPEVVRIVFEESESPRSKWWGVTTGSLTYVSYGITAEQAITNVANELNMSFEELVIVPTFALEYDDQATQIGLTTLYHERPAVRVIPFSTVEWPADIHNTTPEQEAAIERVWGPRPAGNQ